MNQKRVGIIPQFVESVKDFMLISLRRKVNKVIIQILASLITMAIGATAFMVYENDTRLAVIEFQLEQVYPVLQDLSEK